MNKSFWLGFGMILVQVIIALIMLLATLNWSWVTIKLVNQIMLGIAFIAYNLTALIVMIRGIKSTRR